MSYANPPKHTQWQKGQSGNPRGSSRKQRLASAVREIIDRKGLLEELALIVIGKATGREELLTFIDKSGKRVKRSPDLAWFQLLRSMLDLEDDGNGESGRKPLDAKAAARILLALADAEEGPAE